MNGNLLKALVAVLTLLTSIVGYAWKMTERQLDKREAQVTRREERVTELEDALEECRGQPVARGMTPGAATRAAESLGISK